MDQAQFLLVGLPLFLFFSDIINLFTPLPPKPPPHHHHHRHHHQQPQPKPQSAPLDFPTQKESGIGGIGFDNTVNINLCSSCSYSHHEETWHEAAREIRALKEAKNKLQKRVEEFTWRLQLEKRLRQNQDLLIKFISQDLGFSGGRPIVACLIYRSLLQWRSFEVERTSVFDHIIQKIGAAIEGLLASPPQSAGFSFLNGRVLGGLDDLRQVEAKYAAFLFKQQLTTFL
ncbi:hypothetical protein VitviT2T_003922 [Vitis vinifera]|uniref:Uncharacterized protein n=1 Tax=Vitis vinifera TaxID=29760 RepID=A0ABY9BMY0_VITVI|nr:hypothetical protein VitviT2T_003922 [Vitis vinifera]